MTIPGIILTAVILLVLVVWISFAVLSLKEKHHRAARVAGSFALGSLLLGVIFFISPIKLQWIFLGLLGVIGLILVLFLIWPLKQDIKPSPQPNQRVDERTVMFSRARLQPGTPDYAAYYKAHPEHQSTDDACRQNPGLLSPLAAFYHPLPGSSSDGSFFLTEALREAINGPVSPQETSLSPENLTSFVKHLTLYYGACDIGICHLQPHHVYTNIGRGTGDYGAPITLDHQFAIAFTVEMGYEMLNTAPKMPTVMESARQYAEAGKIAVMLAATIRDIGYPARAHIDGNYRVIAPHIAKDAGLGEIGRMGLLITPQLGPRVRLAVVTTDLPLVPDAPSWDPTVIDFCINCDKCAVVCPSSAISFGDRQAQPDGTLRWRIDPERCYSYWTKTGTDCGRCMAVCPYAHADNFVHNMIRSMVNHSAAFRRWGCRLDDLFYGKKPPSQKPPLWLNVD